MVERIPQCHGQGNTLNIYQLNLTFHDVFPLLVDVIFLVARLRSNDGNDPSNEAFVLILEELHMMIHLEVNGHGQLELKHVRQLLNELESVPLFLSMIIFYCLREFIK